MFLNIWLGVIWQGVYYGFALIHPKAWNFEFWDEDHLKKMWYFTVKQSLFISLGGGNCFHFGDENH